MIATKNMKSASMPAITVVITTHNLENYIDRCLQALLDQTMPDFDVLIVDDASTDGTVKKIEEWKTRFNDRIHTTYLAKNLGLPGASRNVALRSGKIQGDYVLFLDGDDSMENDMLEKMYARAVAKSSPDNGDEPVDLVVCAFDRVDEETGRVLATELQGFPEEVATSASDDTIIFINPAHWNKLWRRECIESLTFPSCRIGNDAVFCFRAYANCKKIAFLDDVLVHYSVRHGSISAQTDEEQIWRLAEELLEMYKSSRDGCKAQAGFFAFVHIGLSMALRAADNPQIDIGRHIAETEAYFRNHYDWFRHNRFLTFSSLRKRKMKGVLIWLALLAYKYNLFHPVLLLYRRMGLHIKF